MYRRKNHKMLVCSLGAKFWHIWSCVGILGPVGCEGRNSRLSHYHETSGLAQTREESVHTTLYISIRNPALPHRNTCASPRGARTKYQHLVHPFSFRMMVNSLNYYFNPQVTSHFASTLAGVMVNWVMDESINHPTWNRIVTYVALHFVSCILIRFTDVHLKSVPQLF